MTPTELRTQVAEFSKKDPATAAAIAAKIGDPWFRAQAWAHLARFGDDPVGSARNSAEAALECPDDFQRSAVRAWEIVALAERGQLDLARRSLSEAVLTAQRSEPVGSRAEAFVLLFQASFRISHAEMELVAGAFQRSCISDHWRVVRALKYFADVLNGETIPRPFFW